METRHLTQEPGTPRDLISLSTCMANIESQSIVLYELNPPKLTPENQT